MSNGVEKGTLELEAEEMMKFQIQTADKFAKALDVQGLYDLYIKLVHHAGHLMKSMLLFSDKDVINSLRENKSASADVQAVKEVALASIALAQQVIKSTTPASTPKQGAGESNPQGAG